MPKNAYVISEGSLSKKYIKTKISHLSLDLTLVEANPKKIVQKN